MHIQMRSRDLSCFGEERGLNGEKRRRVGGLVRCACACVGVRTSNDKRAAEMLRVKLDGAAGNHCDGSVSGQRASAASKLSGVKLVGGLTVRLSDSVLQRQKRETRRIPRFPCRSSRSSPRRPDQVWSETGLVLAWAACSRARQAGRVHGPARSTHKHSLPPDPCSLRRPVCGSRYVLWSPVRTGHPCSSRCTSPSSPAALPCRERMESPPPDRTDFRLPACLPIGHRSLIITMHATASGVHTDVRNHVVAMPAITGMLPHWSGSTIHSHEAAAPSPSRVAF